MGRVISEVEIARAVEALESGLKGMATGGPTALERRIRFELEERQATADTAGAVVYLLNEIIRGDSNSAAHALFAQQLRAWDATPDGNWTDGTTRLTSERREVVYVRLKVNPQEQAALSARIPIAKGFGSAVLIANDHKEWYTENVKRLRGTFYWSKYKEYLQEAGGWDEVATASLDESTENVIRCLSDPQREDAFEVRGLVVGYVQSGKTANFTAVIAKALDAGYRLVVVLAGVLDSLRFQTQRRLDKELVGKEQILRDREAGLPHEYCGDQDWGRFATYGGMPSELGAFDIRRITTSISDYQKLGQGRDVLRFEKVHADRPLNHPDNLRSAAARLVVIKKHPAVINKLINDIRGLQTRLDDIPVLVIDDESDQASVNTINPDRKKKSEKSEKDRTSTNAAIVELLAMFARSQYIGYTATPAANALIRPTDTQDLFPRDFIELLPRPANYMGVSDFHDFDEDLNPLSEDEVLALGVRSNKAAFVRPIKDVEGESELGVALDSFFLTGALKLFRASRVPGSISVRHHTMLVHRAVNQDAHEDDRLLVCGQYEKNGYRRHLSKDRLWKLWMADFEPVSVAREPNLPRPSTLEELAPFIDQALERFEGSKKCVLVVNGRDGNKEDMPDFDKENVWNILVGGAKLSRGYTVEGLTITYFLRKAAAADTLMQMGRWFGFRRGYRDLVRLFIAESVAAGKNKKVDLYDLFESVCMDEERFRRRIEIYSREGLRPIQVPPLVPMGMLVPTQRNKMYNAEIQMENFGGKVAESGRASLSTADRQWNVDRLADLTGFGNNGFSELAGFNPKGEKRTLTARHSIVTPSKFLGFLSAYRWATRESQFSSVIGFLQGDGDESPKVEDWLVLVLQNPTAKRAWKFAGVPHGVFARATANQRFNVFSESRHRDVAKHITGVQPLESPNSVLEEMRGVGRAVCLVYPTVAKPIDGTDPVSDCEVTVGLSLSFPENAIRQRINFRVRDGSNSAPAFVDTAD